MCPKQSSAIFKRIQQNPACNAAPKLYVQHQIRETDPERTQSIELVDKEAKITVIDMLLCSRTQRKT